MMHSVSVEVWGPDLRVQESQCLLNTVPAELAVRGTQM